MRSHFRPKLSLRERSLFSFTLIELLVVMAIIAILAALILYAGNSVVIKGQRSRAAAEIQAMSTGMESYKTDNGIYPQSGYASFITNYTSVDPTTTGSSAYYILSSETVYQALSGQTNFLDVPNPGVKVYMAFKANQLGNVTATAGTSAAGTTSFVKDPFNMSYGYSTGYTGGANPSYPFNGNGFFDLWSAGGVTGAQLTAKPALVNDWISNWQ